MPPLLDLSSFAQEVHERLGTPLERFTVVPGAVDPVQDVAGHSLGPVGRGRGGAVRHRLSQRGGR